MDLFEEVRRQAAQAAEELLAQAATEPGDLFVIGCSSSEIVGQSIGQGSSMQAAQAVCDGIWPVLQRYQLSLAAQCCEHLNRALIVEKSALPRGAELVNVVPQPHAGGSFAHPPFTRRMQAPVAVETVHAAAGLDIGNTLIGMHLRVGGRAGAAGDQPHWQRKFGLCPHPPQDTIGRGRAPLTCPNRRCADMQTNANFRIFAAKPVAGAPADAGRRTKRRACTGRYFALRRQQNPKH